MFASRSAALLLTCLFFVVAMTTVASAATVLRMDLEDLLRESDLVVLGSVKAVDSFESEGRIFTDINITVERTFKGAASNQLTIRHLGGRTAELATYVPGMPRFTVGERAFLFLEQPKASPYFVVSGLSQGKWPVTTKDGGAVVLGPALSGLKIVRPDSSKPSLPIESESLDRFESRLRTILDAPDSK